MNNWLLLAILHELTALREQLTNMETKMNASVQALANEVGPLTEAVDAIVALVSALDAGKVLTDADIATLQTQITAVKANKDALVAVANALRGIPADPTTPPA